MSFAFGLGVFAVEDNADDVVHLAHADYKGANEVEASFVAPAFCDGVL